MAYERGGTNTPACRWSGVATRRTMTDADARHACSPPPKQPGAMQKPQPARETASRQGNPRSASASTKQATGLQISSSSKPSLARTEFFRILELRDTRSYPISDDEDVAQRVIKALKIGLADRKRVSKYVAQTETHYPRAVRGHVCRLGHSDPGGDASPPLAKLHRWCRRERGTSQPQPDATEQDAPGGSNIGLAI